MDIILLKEFVYRNSYLWEKLTTSDLSFDISKNITQLKKIEPVLRSMSYNIMLLLIEVYTPTIHAIIKRFGYTDERPLIYVIEYEIVAYLSPIYSH
jgi:hypothetical protein